MRRLLAAIQAQTATQREAVRLQRKDLKLTSKIYLQLKQLNKTAAKAGSGGGGGRQGCKDLDAAQVRYP